MEEFIIDYKVSKKEKTKNICLSFLLAGQGLFSSVLLGTGGNFNLIFYLGVFCSLFGILLALSYIFERSAPLLIINNRQILAKLSSKKKQTVDWASVSKVNIGSSYILFLLNGDQKQEKLELNTFMYKDVFEVKSKVIELCEAKNIPFHKN